MNLRFRWSLIAAALLAAAGCRSDLPPAEVAAAPPVIARPRIPSRVFNIVDYGAVGDGKTVNTGAFRKAIEACSSAGGGSVVVPAGTWFTGPIHLMSDMDLHLDAGATVLFSRNFDDYPLIVTNFEGQQTVESTSPLSGDHLHDVSITGAGIIDGQGEAWRPLKRSKSTAQQWAAQVRAGGAVDERSHTWWPSKAARDGIKGLAKLRLSNKPATIEDYRPYRDLLRPVMVLLSNCHNVLLEGPTFRNSPVWNIHVVYCDNVTVHDVTIFNPYYAQNGDGLDIDSCRDVAVSDSTIDAGDDLICLKSGRNAQGRKVGRPTENVTITNCTLGRGHGGIAIGSEMSGGVRNVNVSHCILRGTDDALRFKTVRGRGGTVENINISDIQMSDIKNACISFDMYYMLKKPTTRRLATRPSMNDEPEPDAPVAKALEVKQESPQPVGPGTPRFRDITVRNIVCTGANIGIQLRGLPEMPLENVTIENAQIVAKQGGVLIDCRGITLRDVQIKSATVPTLQIQDVRNLTMDDDSFVPQELK
ncbi:MAG TPA: glycoside hydrolase family 28 protein [Tepidisphaeraceae bacterium]|nr:glycoside hydrolase family 28 protein [Tepidisphaeraceae bacterium]